MQKNSVHLNKLYGCGAAALFLLISVFILSWWAVILARRRTSVITKNGTREDFVGIPPYYENASGHVGQDNSLNSSGQQLIRDRIDDIEMSGETCSHNGVTFPPEWRPTDKERTCALNITSHTVRNDCSRDNSTLFPEDGVFEDAYIDPDTKRCYVKFSNQASGAHVREYAETIDIEFLLGLIDTLRARLDELRQNRETLANLKTDLLRESKENEERISELESQLDDLDERIDTLENRIDSLQVERDSHEQVLSTAKQNLVSAIDGTKMNFTLDGKHWKLDGTNIRLERGTPMCLTVKADDSRVHGFSKGMVAFFQNDDPNKAVRHKGFTMYTDPLNNGPDYDFGYLIKYENDVITLINDYGGTSYVGYDENRDEVRIYTSPQNVRKWKMEQCQGPSPIYIGPSRPRALPGGWCCTHNGIRFRAIQPLRLGKTLVEANRSGNITVRLSRDSNKLHDHVHTKTFTLKKGTQTIDLDMRVDEGNYFLWHDRTASGTRGLRLYRSESPNEVGKMLRNYENVIQVLEMYNANVRRSWRRYWYSFHNLEVFGFGKGGGGGIPFSNNARCGPDHNTRCPGSQCCSVFGWCGGGTAHCDTHVRSDTMYHGPNHNAKKYKAPTGSWDNSCRNSDIDRSSGMMSAECRTVRGTYRSNTNFEYKDCPNANVKNIDGVLKCS